MPIVVYLHGFLSSPKSAKAQQLARWLADNRPDWRYVCPALSSYPKVAKQQIDHLADEFQREQVLLVGSSLGGFWATYWMERSPVSAVVLVNPAVSPHTRFGYFIGKALPSFYSDEIIMLEQFDLDVLAACDRSTISAPDRYCVLLQTGDETLDYRDAQLRYQATKLHIEEGGNHSFDKFDRHLAGIAQFFESFR